MIDNRNRLLDQAYEVARSLPDGTSLQHAFSDELLGGLLRTFDHLQVLHNLYLVGLRIDSERWAAGHPEAGADELMSNAARSRQTELARIAYEAALRTVVFGHRYEV
ncbi:MAG: hypothetical protein ACREX8_02955 [Gammaproteobacteria bacterium]